uniref:DEK proto-oncogene n=1 Tax=Oryzias latipes TaxID=8090 RepID=A0A3P9I1T7_ORYLA
MFESRPAGTGDKLGDIPRTAHQISRMKPADLKPLHSILYDRPGKVKNLRLFNGFPFQADSEQFHRKRDKLLNNSKLKVVCTVLDLEKKGTHADLIHRILSFLLAPKNSGKVSPDLGPEGGPRSSGSPGSSDGDSFRSIVMDSSSDDEDEDEDERTGASATAAESDGEKPADEEEQHSERSEDEEQVNAAAASDLHLSADSEDDLPLIKMVKTSLSDAELKETLETLLRDADLEEMTMKKICQKVGDVESFQNKKLFQRKMNKNSRFMSERFMMKRF